MKNTASFQQLAFSTQLALGSFAVGTLLFGGYFLAPESEGIIIMGLFFVIFAGFFHSIILLRLLYLLLLAKPSQREAIVIRILILLANIPIALLYLYLIVRSFNSSPIF